MGSGDSGKKKTFIPTMRRSRCPPDSTEPRGARLTCASRRQEKERAGAGVHFTLSRSREHRVDRAPGTI
jgi:hypothetical protein